ncbi:hypothetical protein BGZ60DRAFT_533663 [Tricladium varicosporioides]|nr:hypothetical protein BGZ60DRAFT_533663 [Hymenoscyphus varicosporioides]
MLIKPTIDATSRGALTDVGALRMELFGCWQEAKRADKIAALLLTLRTDLEGLYYDDITNLFRQAECSSRLLRDLFDIFPIYQSRVPLIRYYLHVILPTMSKTMRDMCIYIDNEDLPKRRQWTLMEERLGDQADMTLVERFIMYCEALVQIIRLLSRSPTYHPAMLEQLRQKHIRLRKLQGIPDPQVQIIPHRAPPVPNAAEIEGKRRHWAEKIFDDQPHAATGLKHRRASKCFGYPMPEPTGIPVGSTVLFKLPFDKNRLSITLYLHADGADITRLLCRWTDRYCVNPMYSCFGVHELCIRRNGSSLQFRRWSSGRAHSALWAALFFKTWERMVLFHQSFVALKARCPLTINVNPDDYTLSGEKVLFRAQIIDDGFEHALSVIQDKKTFGLRLHAAVWNGELRRCPVWTAFVTYQSASPSWLHRRSNHRVWLKDINPYVFCNTYKKRHQTRKHGEFEIYFVDRQAADAFEEVFMEEEKDDQIIKVLPRADGEGPVAVVMSGAL